MNICVFSIFDDAYEDISKVSIFKNFKEYCELHAYDLRYFKLNEVPMAASWFKIFYANKLLEENDYDYVFFLDADCLFLNTTVKLESLIKEDCFLTCPEHEDHDGSFNVIPSQFLIKKCKKSREFLSKVWSFSQDSKNPFLHQHPWELNFFNDIVNDKDFKDFVNIVPHKLLNCFWPQNEPAKIKVFTRCNNQIYTPGDFIAHFAGYPLDTRSWLMQEAHNYLSGGTICSWNGRVEDGFYYVNFETLETIEGELSIIIHEIDREKNIIGYKENNRLTISDLKQGQQYFFSFPSSGQKEFVINFYHNGINLAKRIMSFNA
mgnify:FL=1